MIILLVAMLSTRPVAIPPDLICPRLGPSPSPGLFDTKPPPHCGRPFYYDGDKVKKFPSWD
jgi:hypothetical protein